MSGVAISASNAVQFSFWIFSTRSSPPTNSAPAASASRSLSPDAMTATTLLLPPKPCGRTTVPRTIWSAWRVSTPRRIVRSTVSSNLAYLAFWSRGIASPIVYGRCSTRARAFAIFFDALRAISLLNSLRLPPRFPALAGARGTCVELHGRGLDCSLHWRHRQPYKYAAKIRG